MLGLFIVSHLYFIFIRSTTCKFEINQFLTLINSAFKIYVLCLKNSYSMLNVWHTSKVQPALFWSKIFLTHKHTF